MSVLLLSCYELGHQPIGVASPAGFLARAGVDDVEALDLAVERLDADKVRRARFVGISVPMHTALRLGVRAAAEVRRLNPSARLCFYGLYAPLNESLLRAAGAEAILGGEYEEELVRLVTASRAPSPVTLERLHFAPPRRDLLPRLDRYAGLLPDGDPGEKPLVAGYTEASRGCRHHCRHCPIPPVYGGRFFVVPVEVVLADVRRQVDAGARHVTFGDPDFLNGPGHALAVLRAVHAEFPSLTCDVTAKIEHLLHHRALLPELARLGCLFIVSAVESLSDRVLAILDKRHTRADVVAAIDLVRAAGMTLRPSLVPFTPWSTLDDYLDLLEFIAAHDLIDCVDPVQLAIRLLLPPGSLLLEHAEALPYLGPLDAPSLTYRWTHPDPRMDALQRAVYAEVERAAEEQVDALTAFARVRAIARAAAGLAPDQVAPRPRKRAPRLTEPWFC